ncbi:MAG: hypothetical protein V4631_15280 [Pseudomonadota bacterium]
MRIVLTSLIGAALLSGCAQAQVPAPKAAPAEPPPKSIPDPEPDVTLQVGAVLQQVGKGSLHAERLTDKAQAALAAPMLQQMGAVLRPCASPPPLVLLARTTKGEDRNYLYRALCPNGSLLVEVDYNKAARINRLVVRPEVKGSQDPAGTGR